MQPVVSPGDPCVHVLNTGITICQAFVMAAMQGILSAIKQTEVNGEHITPEIVAGSACELADACLAQEMETRKP